jgi:hypothetical protein
VLSAVFVIVRLGVLTVTHSAVWSKCEVGEYWIVFGA